MTPTVARSEQPPLCDSGINSSTTNIIAPTAKLKAYGRIGVTTITSKAPSAVAIGSTIPENYPYIKYFVLVKPSLRREIEITIPLVNYFHFTNSTT